MKIIKYEILKYMYEHSIIHYNEKFSISLLQKNIATPKSYFYKSIKELLIKHLIIEFQDYDNKYYIALTDKGIKYAESYIVLKI